MPTNYPTSLDSLTNPTSSDPQNNPSHSGQHANANDAIEAIETFLGTSSAPLPTILDTDGTLAANSDVKIASQKATKTYADTKLSISSKATAVQAAAGTDDTNYLTSLSAASHMNYGLSRQAIINGNFDVWQRGTSVALADVTLAFQADRFADYVDKNGGTLPTLTRSRQLLTSGDIPNSFYFTRLATNGAGTSLGVSSRGVLYQAIEFGTSKLCGLNKKVTVSFWARSDISNKRICPTLTQYYGSGGSPSATEDILGTPITLTSSWTKYTATFTTNTLVGKTFGTANDNYLALNFYYMWGTTSGNAKVQAGVTAETFVGAGNIDIAQVQLCSGDVALPFNPKSFEEELRACQRYYEKSYDYSTNIQTATTTGSVFSGILTSYLLSYETVYYKVKKRIGVTPTLRSVVGGSTGVVSEYNNAGVFVAERAAAAADSGENSFNAQGTAGTLTVSAYGAGSFVRFHWTAEAEL